jgi:hypothetical protein
VIGESSTTLAGVYPDKFKCDSILTNEALGQISQVNAPEYQETEELAMNARSLAAWAVRLACASPRAHARALD